MKNTDEQMIDIDKTQVRGNIRTFITVIISTITIVYAVISSANSINTKITTLNLNFEKQNELNDLRLRTFDVCITNLEIETKEIRDRQDVIAENNQKNKQ